MGSFGTEVPETIVPDSVEEADVRPRGRSLECLGFGDELGENANIEEEPGEHGSGRGREGWGVMGRGVADPGGGVAKENS